MYTYISNLIRLMGGKRDLQPLTAIFYVTTHCNLNCSYCEDFGARRNALSAPPLPLSEALKILSVIRSGVSRLWITGGEPLLVPHIAEMISSAKHDLKFDEITLISNGTLLHDHAATLADLDRLVISLDALEPRLWSALNMPESYAIVLDNIRFAAELQKNSKLRVTLNAVITPETLTMGPSGLTALLEFCRSNQIMISFSPQAANNWPRYELLTSPEYSAFIEKLIEFKKRGAPILGSFAYLKNMLNPAPYECYPTLAPRIMPDGSLTYPCRPMEKAGGEQGGRPINLRDVNNWHKAWQSARNKYGEPPRTCVSCFQQCYAEPSLMQLNPLKYLFERALYSRGINLTTYTPG